LEKGRGETRGGGRGGVLAWNRHLQIKEIVSEKRWCLRIKEIVSEKR
jgi:hypothetical protein